MKKTFLFVSITLLFTQNVSSQTPGNLKSKITKIIKEALQEKHQSYGWIACNKDSSYYKSETIELYDNWNYAYSPETCCNFISWDFDNKTTFYLTDKLICQEPTVSSVHSFEKKFKIAFKRHFNHLFLLKTDRNNVQEQFEVIGFKEVTLWNKIQKSNVITLKRIHNDLL